MIRRLIVLALTVGLLVVGALIYEANTLRTQVPTLRASQQQLGPRIAADRKAIGALQPPNQRDAAQLRRAQRDVLALRNQRAAVHQAGWRSAFEPARAAAYSAAYNDTFPIALGSSDWYVVHAERRSGYYTTSWDATEDYEYVVEDGSISTYALGAAPAPYSTSVPGYYNADGIWVPSPSSNPTLTPSGPTAICNDGTYSYSLNHSGTCSWHGGVSTWLR